MDVYRTDEEQAEAIKKWWAENGKSIVVGIFIGLAAVYGWRWWQDYKIEQAEAASEIYQEMVVAVRDDKNADAAQKTAERIISDYGSTAYALFTKLTLAKLAVDEKEYVIAEDHLRWALDNNHEDSLEHLIRLRLARVLIAQEKSDAAMTLLDVKAPGQFGNGYDELRGDIFNLRGDSEAARSAYQQAITKKRSLGNDISLLEMKLDDLGRLELQ